MKRHILVAVLVALLAFSVTLSSVEADDNRPDVWNYGMCVSHDTIDPQEAEWGPWTAVINHGDQAHLLAPEPPRFTQCGNCGVWWWH